MRVRLILAPLLLLTACGTDSGAVDNRIQDSCGYDFQAAVTDGPDKGMSLSGKLALTPSDVALKFGGALIPAGKENDPTGYVLVHGDKSGNDISLTFLLDHDKQMVGRGSFTGDFPKCGDQLQGSLTGPDAADTGDWSGVRVTITVGSILGSAAALACFAGCSYLGGTDAACDKRCGTQTVITTN